MRYGGNYLIKNLLSEPIFRLSSQAKNRKKISLAVIALFLAGFSSYIAAKDSNNKSASHTTGESPSNNVTFQCQAGSQYIDGIGYDNSYYQPRVHFRGQDDNHWAYLSYSQGVNTDYGKAALSLALTAYSTGTNVFIECNGSTDVEALWLRRYVD